MQAEEYHFSDIYRLCTELKTILESVSTSNNLKHISYYVNQANDHIESIQQLVSTLYMIVLDKNDNVAILNKSMGQLLLDFDDEEE